MADEKKKNRSIPSLLITCVLGLFMILWPNATMGIACRLLGIALMAGSAYIIYCWFKEKSKEPSEIAKLVGSAAIFLVGLWILINPDAFRNIVKTILGIALVAAGLLTLYKAYKSGKNKVSMIIAGVTALLGILIIAVPFTTEKIALICIGVALVYTGVTGILSEMNVIK